MELMLIVQMGDNIVRSHSSLPKKRICCKLWVMKESLYLGVKNKVNGKMIRKIMSFSMVDISDVNLKLF